MNFRETLVTIASGMLLVAIFFFGYGMAVGRYELWPFGLVEQGK